MWELVLKLRDPAEATQVINEVSSREELAGTYTQVTKYPDDGQVVARSMDRTPLARLGIWGLNFNSSRVSLTERNGGDW